MRTWHVAVGSTFEAVPEALRGVPIGEYAKR